MGALFGGETIQGDVIGRRKKCLPTLREARWPRPPLALQNLSHVTVINEQEHTQGG